MNSSYPRKRKYAPLYKSVRVPRPGTGLGPNDGVFLRLKTHSKMGYTALTPAASPSAYIPIPINYLYYDAVADVWDQFVNITATGGPGMFHVIQWPSYTGWSQALAPFALYKIAGVAVKLRFYVPFSQDTPKIFKVGLIAERDFGAASVPHFGGTVANVLGAAQYTSSGGGLLSNSTNWNLLNQKVYRQTTSQPGTQTYVTLSCYFDAAKLLHWSREKYRVDTQVQASITTDAAAEMTAIDQPATPLAAQAVFETVAATDGTVSNNMPNFMIDMEYTYLIKAFDPNTVQNIVAQDN